MSLTLEKILKARDILDEGAGSAEEYMRKNGYWTIEIVRMPKTKKRRIRNKWIRDGRAFGYIHHPPVVQ